MDGTDLHFSWTKNARLVLRNDKIHNYAFFWCKSIRWNLEADEEQYAGSMIKVRKWNQMVVEFDGYSSIKDRIWLENKYNAIESNLKINETCIFVDEDCIQKVWRKTVNKNVWTSYKNLKYYKAELSDASSDVVLKGFDTLEKRWKRLKVNLHFTLHSENIRFFFQINFSHLNEFIVENLKINFKNYFKNENITYILKTIKQIKRAKEIWFEVDDERVLEFIFSYIQTYGFWHILTIQSKIKVSDVSEFILKRKWKQFYYKFTE